MEPQPAQPLPGNHYDFILNPEKPQKRGLLGGLGGDSLIAKIVFLIGGAVIFMVVMAVVINLFFGSKTSLDTLVGIAQTEQEIVRLGSLSKDATDQAVKNASLNTQLTVKSHQQVWLAFLAERSRTVKSEELVLKRDSATDKKLRVADQTSTFDTTYTTVMKAQLEAYSAALKTAYQGASNKKEKELLAKHYDDVKLLLKQWPASTLSLSH